MSTQNNLAAPVTYASLTCIAFGTLGSAFSFLHLASWSSADLIAGASGFVAGAILIGSGLVSCAILALPSSASEG